MADAKPPHPGRIEFVDEATGAVTGVLDAQKVADAVRYARDEHGAWVAVVRIVERVDGARLSFKSYAADGRLVRTGSAARR